MLQNRGNGSLGHFIAHSFQCTNAIHGPLVQETTREYEGIYSSTTHITNVGEMSCGVRHLSVRRKNFDDTIPGTQLSGPGTSCNRKVLYVRAAVACMDVRWKEKRLITPSSITVRPGHVLVVICSIYLNI